MSRRILTLCKVSWVRGMKMSEIGRRAPGPQPSEVGNLREGGATSWDPSVLSL